MPVKHNYHNSRMDTFEYFLLTRLNHGIRVMTCKVSVASCHLPLPVAILSKMCFSRMFSFATRHLQHTSCKLLFATCQLLFLICQLIFSSTGTKCVDSGVRRRPSCVVCRASLTIYLNIFSSETKSPRTLIFGMQHHLMDVYEDCSNYDPRAKNGPAQGLISFSQGNLKKSSSLKV